MIYLIDDKKLRQQDFGWKHEDFAKHYNFITLIYNLKDLEEERTNLFKKDNIVLFHESFFDNPINISKDNSDILRQEFIDEAQDKTTKVIIFSGSVASRKVDGYLAYCSPANIYKNLNFVLNKAKKDQAEISIKDLLFGENYKVEEILHLKSQIWDLLYRSENTFTLNNKLNSLINQFNQITGKGISVSNEIDIHSLKNALNN